MSLTLPTEGAFVDTLAKGGVSTVQVRIIRGFGALTAATESNFQRYWFIGTLADTRVNRVATVGNVRSVEYIFDKTVGPRDSFQPVCNNSLYEGRCGRGIDIADFTYTAELVEVAKDGTEVVLEINPGTQHGNDPEDHWQIGDGDVGDINGVGYFTLGQAWDSRLDAGRRMVIEHSYDPLDGVGRNGNPIARFRLMAPLSAHLTERCSGTASAAVSWRPPTTSSTAPKTSPPPTGPRQAQAPWNPPRHRGPSSGAARTA